jgi:hypothetical protein
MPAPQQYRNARIGFCYPALHLSASNAGPGKRPECLSRRETQRDTGNQGKSIVCVWENPQGIWQLKSYSSTPRSTRDFQRVSFGPQEGFPLPPTRRYIPTLRLKKGIKIPLLRGSFAIRNPSGGGSKNRPSEFAAKPDIHLYCKHNHPRLKHHPNAVISCVFS